MTLRQLLLILRAHYRIALLTVLGTVGATLAVSLMQPRQYTASTSMIIDVKSPDPIAGMIVPALTMPGYLATQVDIIRSDRVAQRVVKTLKLDASAAAREQWHAATGGRGDMLVWLAQALKGKLEVTPSRESSVVTITFKAVDPVFAAAVANAFADSYIRTTIELRVEPARQYSEWFTDQNAMVRDSLERAQAKLSAYQQDHGIVANEERFDNEVGKLNEISTQLTVVQAQTAELQSKQRSGSASDTLPEIVQNPLIQNLKGELARAEAKLQELAGNIGRNHPQYQRAQAEIASLGEKIESETRHISSGFSTSSTIGRQREASLKAALDAQKRRVLDLRRDRAELTVLNRDVEAAQRAFEAVSQRLNQSRLESQSTQTNVSVLTPAAEPVTPSSPNVTLNALVALMVGSVLGIAAAFMLEAFDRRIRSAYDLGEFVPVLSVVARPVKERRPARTRSLPALPAV
jgi:succinoglycan biosynthesis transport protein ExoP